MSDTKYIFFDIDGTLLNSEAKVAKSSKLCLKKLQENGHKTFINTGRARNLIPKLITDLNFDGYVAGTGSYADYRDKIIFEKYFDLEQTNRVIDLLDGNNFPFIMSAGDGLVSSKKNIPIFIEQFTNGKIKAKDIDNLSSIDDPFFESIPTIIIDDDLKNYYYNHPKISDIVYVKSHIKVSELNKLIGDDIRFEKASFKDPDESSGEITLADYSKAIGIQYVLDYFNANQNDCICIGDGFNDLDMLEYAGLSIAMGNSPDEIKNVSDYVTDDIYNDGVYKAFEHFKLI